MLLEGLCVPELGCFPPVWKKTHQAHLEVYRSARLLGRDDVDSMYDFLCFSKEKQKTVKRSLTSLRRERGQRIPAWTWEA